MEVRDQIQARGADLVAFYNAPPDLVDRWFERADVPRDLMVGADVGAGLYDALGTGRPSYAGLLKGASRPFLEAFRAGYRPRLTQADMRRLGADVVVGAGGEILRLHLPTGIGDRLAPADILAALDSARG